MAHKCDGCRYKGQHQEMMFRPMGVCTRELNLVDAVKNYEAEKCPYKKTNADRIRAMRDAMLAHIREIAISGFWNGSSGLQRDADNRGEASASSFLCFRGVFRSANVVL